jgi:AcrR family transcriptional regulator
MRKNKKELNIPSAYAEFSDSGYEKTSIESILRTEGVSQGLFRDHFINKVTLYFIFLLFVIRGLRDQIQCEFGAWSLGMREATAEFVLSYKDHTSDPSTGYAMVYREPPFEMIRKPAHVSGLADLSLEVVQILALKLSAYMTPRQTTRLAVYVATKLHGIQRARFSSRYRELIDIDELADFFAMAVQSMSGEKSEDRIRLQSTPLGLVRRFS